MLAFNLNEQHAPLPPMDLGLQYPGPIDRIGSPVIKGEFSKGTTIHCLYGPQFLTSRLHPGHDTDSGD